jgi:hypothetical protein
MIKLIESGLFGGRLIAVDTPELVRRYNACLTDIGLPNTQLSHFHIDGWGWSPEVADELDDRYYLCHGIANPYGILISPRQKDCSLYFPIHSFDWDIHQFIFQLYEEAIKEVTALSGLWFELDQEITTYRSPKDLLLIDGMSIRFKSSENLMKAAKHQKELVRKFNDETDGWNSSSLRAAILDSARSFGDLRFQNLDIPESRYSDIQSFYTPGFGGVFVVQETQDGRPILVYDSVNSELSGESGHSHVEFNLTDSKLLPYLFSHQLVSDQTSFYLEHPGLLRFELDQWLMWTAAKDNESTDLKGLSSARRKGLVNQLLSDQVLGEDYLDFENVVRQVDKGKAVAISNTALTNRFIHPHRRLKQQTKSVIWQIISNLFKQNHLLLYTFNKSEFYLQFQQWPENYQDWIIGQIKQRRGLYNELMN